MIWLEGLDFLYECYNKRGFLFWPEVCRTGGSLTICFPAQGKVGPIKPWTRERQHCSRNKPAQFVAYYSLYCCSPGNELKRNRYWFLVALSALTHLRKACYVCFLKRYFSNYNGLIACFAYMCGYVLNIIPLLADICGWKVWIFGYFLDIMP